MKPKTKKGEIALSILSAIGLTGLLVVGIAAPNIFKALPNPYRKKYPKKALDQSISRLKCKGFIKFAPGKFGYRLELTEDGRRELSMYETRQKLLRPQKIWRGKWHLLVFDIPEERKNIRHQVRRTLVSLGFYRLQDSVWVYPHECEDVLELLRTKHKIRYEALYIRAEKIAKDKWLRQHFGLPNA